jgi:threonylcarbamoyladenosine tRNA methylthiotransferase MtaB
VIRARVESLGCRANQADGDALAAGLAAQGCTLAESGPADVMVLNTCSVTAEAERDARAIIRKTVRDNPSARIVVTGCYAQRAPQELAALPGVTAVAGNSHKGAVVDLALGRVPSGRNGFVTLDAIRLPSLAPMLVSDDFAHADIALPTQAGGNRRFEQRTRPSLKIQDGCGNRCSFCIIPTTRGASRSLPASRILADVESFLAGGGAEMVLSGINLGRWGRDLTPTQRLEDLIGRILAETALPRLRISSLEPMDWTEGLIAQFAHWGAGEHPRLARHAHIPLQSGSDAVLRRMHRRYRPWHYAAQVEALRAASPHAAIGADVMVGFPGETDAEFQETYDFIAAQPLTYLHLFSFSARPGTPAWRLHQEAPVHGTAVRDRMRALRGLIEGKNRAFRQQFIGTRLSAITLRSDGPAGSALTDNFLPVALDGARSANQRILVQATALTADGVAGRVLRGAISAIPG